MRNVIKLAQGLEFDAAELATEVVVCDSCPIVGNLTIADAFLRG